jgi:hypothetical protein
MKGSFRGQRTATFHSKKLMSGVIAFSDEPEESWVMAGWVFRQVLEDVASQHSADTEMLAKFEVAEAIGGLHVRTMESQLKVRTTNAIKETVSDILSGKKLSGIRQKPYGDQRKIDQYHSALQELMETIHRFEAKAS